MVHQSEHPVSVTQNHAAPPPGYDCGEECRDFNVTQIVISSWKLHGVVGYEVDAVYALRLCNQQPCDVARHRDRAYSVAPSLGTLR